jgi:hypothetical protein
LIQNNYKVIFLKQIISPAQEDGLRRLYFSEYKRLTRAGEAGPFAAMMANRAQMVERNKLLRRA